MPAAERALDWARDGPHWPLRENSRFVEAAGVRWHVQVSGQGPVVLLLHGTGASVHSWRGLAQCLAEHFTLVAPDLPGHGFTSRVASGPPSLPNIGRALTGLLAHLQLRPEMAIGHSAGAAIAVQLAMHEGAALRGIVGINAALLPFPAVQGALFRPAARLLAATPIVSRLFARRAADRGAVERLVASTGSVLAPAGIDLYARLMADPGHVAGALAMMAHWDLAALARCLPQLRVPLLLLAGTDDRTVAPRQAARVARLAPQARVVELPGLGHLAHEEQPQEVAALCRQFARDSGVGDR